MSSAHHDLPTIAYLVKTWPKVSETFILQEVRALEQDARRIHIFSLQRPTDARFHDATRRIEASVSYLDIGAASTPMTCLLLLANLLRRPLRTLAALGSARTRRTGEPSRLIQLGQALRLIREMKRRGITHLHAHFISEPGDVAEWMNRLAGINYSISAHAKDIYLSSSEALRDKIQRASFVVTCTEYNRRHLQRIAAPGTPILRVYHGLDGTRFRSLANSAEPAQGGDPLILSVGRLREKKGFPTLIEACHLLA
ncbi:MAG TPA: colanic acid biosynthesis glycosyltransferase WcaL, partial [Gammaproteobacteria bacterium]|nr:colanic acid biosynthesis glycosyltransferase WcaL [Gammaproteobacteria bacterium]